MTAVTATPGTGGRRRRAVLMAVAVVMMIVAAFLIFWASKAEADLTCGNAGDKVVEIQKAIQDTQRTDYSSGPKGQQEYQARVKQLNDELGNAYGKVVECKEKGHNPGTSTTIAAPNAPPAECNGVVFRSYLVNGVQPGASVRFGPMPVNVSGPGDVGKVVAALNKEPSSDAFKAAVLTQANYLVDGGITADQVQATATRFQQNPDQWRDSNRVIRAKLSRASFELVPFNGSYNTQDAVLGANQCVAPAAQPTTSHGQRWILVVHLSQQDGGRTVRLVVDCDFQIQEFGPAPKKAPPTTAPPASTPTTRPYVPPTVPSTTAPPRTTTTTAPPPPSTTTTRPYVPPTTTTLPNKTCTKDPSLVRPGLPLCTGTPSR